MCRSGCLSSQTASDSDKEKKQRDQSTVEQEENKKEFNSGKHVLEILHKSGI